jgi:hypothetical protein
MSGVKSRVAPHRNAEATVFHTKPSSTDAGAIPCAPIRTLADSGRATAHRNLKIVDRSHPARPRARVERQHAESREEPLVEKILHSFNTWSFKREQPDNPVSLRLAIAHAVHRKEPIPFVLYWGKGPRHQAGKPEATCLNYLSSFADRILSVYEKGAALRLICTDTHATLNGHSPTAIDDYFGSIRVKAQAHGFTDCRLADLVRTAQEAGKAQAIDIIDPDQETVQRLSESAAKWYRGEGSASKGAIEYYRMNMIEKRAVEFAFPHAVFITFNGGEFRSLFPDHMPVFYMYSIKRGVAVKPWFLPDETQ